MNKIYLILAFLLIPIATANTGYGYGNPPLECDPTFEDCDTGFGSYQDYCNHFNLDRGNECKANDRFKACGSCGFCDCGKCIYLGNDFSDMKCQDGFMCTGDQGDCIARPIPKPVQPSSSGGGSGGSYRPKPKVVEIINNPTNLKPEKKPEPYLHPFVQPEVPEPEVEEGFNYSWLWFLLAIPLGVVLYFMFRNKPEPDPFEGSRPTQM